MKHSISNLWPTAQLDLQHAQADEIKVKMWGRSLWMGIEHDGLDKIVVGRCRQPQPRQNHD
ncbi:MAG: hypothetical protein M9965_15610 [Anaerolineae bacterium]|nr:hypothetical protein [Anaerolineae bacterium]